MTHISPGVQRVVFLETAFTYGLLADTRPTALNTIQGS